MACLQEHAGAGATRRQARLPLGVVGGAPLLRGVLALLEPRGALRRDRGDHREPAHRVRRAAHAAALQPPGPHRGVRRGPRPHERRSGGVRHRSLGHPRRARGFRHQPGRHARDVGRGRQLCGRVLDQRRRRVPRQVLGSPAAARDPEAEAVPAPADLGRDHVGRRARGDGPSRSRRVLVHGRCAARRPQGARRPLPVRHLAVHEAHRQVRERPGGDVHDGELRADA